MSIRTIQTGIGAVEVERVKLLVEVKSRGLTDLLDFPTI
jgi:hypothetical protein